MKKQTVGLLLILLGMFLYTTSRADDSLSIPIERFLTIDGLDLQYDQNHKTTCQGGHLKRLALNDVDIELASDVIAPDCTINTASYGGVHFQIAPMMSKDTCYHWYYSLDLNLEQRAAFGRRLITAPQLHSDGKFEDGKGAHCQGDYISIKNEQGMRIWWKIGSEWGCSIFGCDL